MAQEVEHHRSGPDHGDRIGNVAAIDIRRRAVHRFKERRERALRIEVSGRREPDSAGTGGSEVRENVAEQVRCYDDIEPLRLQDEARTQNIDVLLVPRDLWIVACDLRGACIPPGHADSHAIALGGHSDMLVWSLLSQVKCKLQLALSAMWREDRFLDDKLALGALEHHAAH